MNGNLDELKQDYMEGLKEFDINKSRISELNTRNSEVCKVLDGKYGYPKGTSRAYFIKKLKEREDKDLTEDVFQLDSAIREASA